MQGKQPGMDKEAPFVSVVTPVYNGEAYLDECIRSVRSQTYRNWEYVIVDNQSTDATPDIARQHAAEDDRIRVVRNRRFLPLIKNWNKALTEISVDSGYCKVLHADDLLLPECLEKMVDVAKRHPSVGLVGAYVRKGNHIVGAEFPFPDEVRAGHKVARDTLLKRYYVFGSPSSTLLRSDLLRRAEGFYNENNLHADVEVCFEVLKRADFGFVHQVLTYTREHEDSQTSTVANRFKSNLLENQMSMLYRYGPELLSDKEFCRMDKRLTRRYYRELARDIQSFRDPAFRSYQKDKLKRLGLKLDSARLARAVAARAAGVLYRPRHVIAKLGRSGQAPR